MGSELCVKIIGNVGNEPKLSQVKEQTVCNFNVAANRGKGDKKETFWARVSIWGANAESAAEYIHKGDQVAVEGHWARQDVYQGSASFTLFAERFTLLNNQRDGNGHTGDDAQPSTDIPF